MKLSIGGWSMLGFSVGAFWLFVAFCSSPCPDQCYVSGQGRGCHYFPPLMADIYFPAPILNAAIYGAAAFAWSRVVGQ
jgi:hypothetical protein